MLNLPNKENSFLNIRDVQLISVMRAVLAVAMLIAIYLDPSEPGRYASLTLVLLILYSSYAILLYIFSLRREHLIPVGFAHWIDVAWYLVLVTLSSGTSSIFFFLFFFAILVASFRFGFTEGMRVTAASAFLFILLGYFAAPGGDDFELNRFLLRPIYLGVLGSMIAYWGGRELLLKQRLELIKDINKIYNPRFGTDLTISSILRKIRTAFDADACLLISFDAGSSAYSLRQCHRESPDAALYAEPLDGGSPLTALRENQASIYCNFRYNPLEKAVRYTVSELPAGKRVEAPFREGELIADLLDTKSFVTVPVYQREAFTGRLYLTSKTRVFDEADAEFLGQILEHAMPVIENVNLLDRLASEATEQQRRKISRDIHDSTVQPYIGIKFGLEAVQLRQSAGEDVSGDIAQLIEMASSNIISIRSYINKLKGDEPGAEKGAVLVTAIRQQARKIGEFYGINIEVGAADDIHISDRLSAEIFQIVTEGLSNIKRHTKADRAAIMITADEKKLRLEIENNAPESESGGVFTPKSILGRAESLGGKTLVENKNGLTRVAVEIPL